MRCQVWGYKRRDEHAGLGSSAGPQPGEVGPVCPPVSIARDALSLRRNVHVRPDNFTCMRYLRGPHQRRDDHLVQHLPQPGAQPVPLSPAARGSARLLLQEVQVSPPAAPPLCCAPSSGGLGAFNPVLSTLQPYCCMSRILIQPH